MLSYRQYPAGPVNFTASTTIFLTELNPLNFFIRPAGKNYNGVIQMNNFRYSLYRNVGLAIEHYNMINEGDRVLVALSGGKDSFAMLDSLARLKLRSPVKFSIFVCIVNSGFPGYAVDKIESWLKERNFEYHIEKSDMYESIFLDPVKAKDGCFYCSRQRRSILYRLADANNCQKIALGHHLDDFIETALMSMMYNGKIETMLPIFEVGSKKFRVIRPLMYVSEETTKNYCRRMEFPAITCCCPQSCAGTLKRTKIKKMLLDFCEDDRKVKETMFRSLANFNAEYMLDLRYNQKLSQLKYEKINSRQSRRGGQKDE